MPQLRNYATHDPEQDSYPQQTCEQLASAFYQKSSNNSKMKTQQ